MNSEQTKFMKRLNLPTSFSDLSDEQLIRIEDRLSEEMQLHGLNDAGDGLNDYGALCLSIIDIIPDD